MLLVVVSFRENNGEQNKIKKIHIRRKKKGVRHTHSITEKGKSEQEMDRRRRQPRCIRQKKRPTTLERTETANFCYPAAAVRGLKGCIWTVIGPLFFFFSKALKHVRAVRGRLLTLRFSLRGQL